MVASPFESMFLVATVVFDRRSFIDLIVAVGVSEIFPGISLLMKIPVVRSLLLIRGNGGEVGSVRIELPVSMPLVT